MQTVRTIVNYFKKALRISFIAFFSLVFVSLIWFLLPQKDVNTFDLLNDQFIIYGIFNIKTESKVLNFVETNLLEEGFQRKGFRFATSLFCPVEIIAALDYVPNAKKPNYVFIVKNSKLNKLAKIYNSVVTLCNFVKRKDIKINFGFVGDIILVSDRQELVHSVTNIYTKKSANIKSLLLGKGINSDLLVYIANFNNKFSDFINTMEKKSSYSFFPNSEYVNSMEISLRIINDKNIKGQISLSPKVINKKAELLNDLSFIMETLRRLCLANKFTLAYEAQQFNLDKIYMEFNLRKEP